HGRDPARDILRARLVGERLQEDEQMRGLRRARQGDLSDAVEVEALHSRRQLVTLARLAVYLEARSARSHPQADGRVRLQGQQRAKSLLLLVLHTRGAEQAPAAHE